MRKVFQDVIVITHYYTRDVTRILRERISGSPWTPRIGPVDRFRELSSSFPRALSRFILLVGEILNLARARAFNRDRTPGKKEGRKPVPRLVL